MKWVVRELSFQLSEFLCSSDARQQPMERRRKRLEKLMTKKMLAFPLVLAIVLWVCCSSAFAEGTKKSEPAGPVEVKETAAKEAIKVKTKLKIDLDKLMADAKSGKIAPRSQQFPQTSRNNLSKTTKIAILAAAVGSAIFLAVLFHDLSKD